MISTTLNLIVLRTADLTGAVAFYETFGWVFMQQQHGTGPVHYSCEAGGTVIELYPGKSGSAPDRKNAGATLLGFQVTDLDTLVERLTHQGAVIITAPQDSAWGRRAVILDLDGRAIELTQKI